jgi:hypothetical protein
MKLKNLDQEMTTLNGGKIMLTPTAAMTYRSALVSACETHQGQPGSGENVRAYSLGGKILDAKEELELTKEDVEFLEKVIDGNSSFMAVVVGRLLDFINNN